ncbi:hypothetical protein [Rhodospirillum rubrum]|uniref:Transmembrane protein n=1 Tax=Rhodospirillum rubrum (strain ATCC 11170 / ATH 1.1.1 / DSM 467 / LMG 4362 / NCIMB 8255 / S1) TaxID=269796 RepID=Q2RVL6_RHORT|nr:hypothetical protein [Rhodospirillum rubrum]ABC21829.1 hypothetical protein Rru_A1028 [Rhodospirillum rubrum ATCC 11170]AEO47529.1 hypothetical protein F11_05295 [Rhodospirillum rubrum F11]MBK5953386.1 hypothetical protein [Rhodospirillum rubrum]QXG81490.1 hypothetical protein KUL73_05355 [Rhodospirillum rubrum]HAP99587.1 hypothetical protein [Rhodospirillum rubrum]
MTKSALPQAETTTAAPAPVESASPVALKRERLRRDRALAKNGMVLSMGALVLTGALHGHGARKAHVAAGVALMGFAYWHHTLYPTSGR